MRDETGSDEGSQERAEDNRRNARSVPAPATTDSAAGQTKSETIYTCPMDPQIVQDHPGKCPICGMDLVKKTRTLKVESSAQTRKIAYYRSPMDPKQTSPTPRKDEMGMDYVPVYKDELSQGTNPVEGRAEIAISPRDSN